MRPSSRGPLRSGFMIRILLHAPHDLGEWRRAGDAGERPGRGPYGIEHLPLSGEVELVQWQWPGWLQGVSISRARERLENRLGVALARPLLSLRAVRSADVAIAVLEAEGYVHAVLRRLRVPPWKQTPIAFVSCWLAERAVHATGGRLRRLRFVAQSADLIIYWSSNQADIYVNKLGVDRDRLLFVPFGIENEFYRPPTERPEAERPYVFSAGRDQGRDYATLFEAADGLPLPVKVVCPYDMVSGLKRPPNVELLGEVDHESYLRLLQNATVVAISSSANFAYPTGQTVLLNAMACKRPVVITENRALDDYVRHGVDALVAEPRNPESVRDAILSVISDDGLARRLGAAGSQAVDERFNSRIMWAAIRQRVVELARRAKE